MRRCVEICRRCPKRLVVVRNDDGKVKFYKCMGRDEYEAYVKNCHQSFIMKLMFALDSKTGNFISPFEEFRDIFWRPLPYVEKRKIRMGDRRFFRLINEKMHECEMFPEMQMMRWNDGEKLS